MRYVIGLLLFLLLTSCASTTSNYYTKTVDSWRGGNANSLVKQWGKPDEKWAAPDGDTFYVYKTISYQTYPTAAPVVGVHVSPTGRPVIYTASNNNAGNRGMAITCITVFTANKKGVITNVESQGPSCYGGEGFADKMRRS